MNRSLVAFLAACSSPSPQPAPPVQETVETESYSTEEHSESLSGSFVNEHTVMVVCDKPDWCEETVTDRLNVTSNGDQIEVEIELVQANAHTCTFEGTLEPAGTRTWRWQAPADSEDGPCDLELQWGEGEIKISSEGCRHYCGARARLEAIFSL